MRPTLEAFGVPGSARARRRGPRALRAAEQKYGRDVIRLILARIDRHVESAAIL